ncbi:MAG: hypothetical protein ACYTG0_03405 [Planctomycetota bacterium]|jgi:hypothetical protein
MRESGISPNTSTPSAAKLPGKTMKPEDWKLDPAVEKEGTGGLSHEYVWDGMAVAQGKLFLAMKDGTIRCFQGNSADE